MVPVRSPEVAEEPILDFTSGYVVRSLDELPKQGDREPWRLRQNYVIDLFHLRRSPIEDGGVREYALDAHAAERLWRESARLT